MPRKICYRMLFIFSTKSGRKLDRLWLESCCNFASSRMGRTIVKQCRSRKNCLMALRMLFLRSCASVVASVSYSDISRYSSSVSGWPSRSTSSSEKSRSTHTKDGIPNSSLRLPKCFCISRISLKLLSAFSSITPNEL